MTFKKLKSIIEKNNIPESVHFLSDSGWECSATEMDGVFYNAKENKIVFTQDNEHEVYLDFEDYKDLSNEVIE